MPALLILPSGHLQRYRPTGSGGHHCLGFCSDNRAVGDREDNSGVDAARQDVVHGLVYLCQLPVLADDPGLAGRVQLNWRSQV